MPSNLLFGGAECRSRNKLAFLRFILGSEKLCELALHTTLQPFCNIRLLHNLFGIQSFLDKGCDTGINDVFGF